MKYRFIVLFSLFIPVFCMTHMLGAQSDSAAGVFGIASELKNDQTKVLESGDYSFQCSLMTSHKGDVTFLKNWILIPNANLKFVQSRLGVKSICVMLSDDDVVLSKNVFDGEAAFSINAETKSIEVYPGGSPPDQIQTQGFGLLDPLADVLGMNVVTAEPIARIVSRLAPPYNGDLPTALKSGSYAVVSEDENEIQLRCPGVDEVVLSKKHGYSVLRRKLFYPDKNLPLASLTNNDWRQTPKGFWYPGSSQIEFYGTPDNRAGEVCVEYHATFESRPPVQPTDFDVRLQGPEYSGWTIAYCGKDGYKNVYFDENKEYHLSEVATGEQQLVTRPGSAFWGLTLKLLIWGNIALVALVTGLEYFRRSRRKAAEQ